MAQNDHNIFWKNIGEIQEHSKLEDEFFALASNMSTSKFKILKSNTVSIDAINALNLAQNISIDMRALFSDTLKTKELAQQLVGQKIIPQIYSCQTGTKLITIKNILNYISNNNNPWLANYFLNMLGIINKRSLEQYSNVSVFLLRDILKESTLFLNDEEIYFSGVNYANFIKKDTSVKEMTRSEKKLKDLFEKSILSSTLFDKNFKYKITKLNEKYIHFTSEVTEEYMEISKTSYQTKEIDLYRAGVTSALATAHGEAPRKVNILKSECEQNQHTEFQIEIHCTN